jgi:hypothetical protein
MPAQPATYVPAPGEALAVQQAEAVAMLRRVIEQASSPLRWPMYVRNVKQLLRAADSAFDERRYGFGGILDLLRASQRDAVLRLERDRQGVLRVFPGNALQRPSSAPPVQEATLEESVAAAPDAAGEPGPAPEIDGNIAVAPASSPEVEVSPVIDAEMVETVEIDAQPEERPAGQEAAKPKRRRGAPAAGARKPAGVRKAKVSAPTKARGKKKE